MNKRNSSGPRTVPWGTPDSTSAHDDASPSTTTCCDLFWRKPAIQAPTLPFMPYCPSFIIRHLCGMASNALEKSRTAMSTWDLLSYRRRRSCNVVISRDSQECLDLKPCWRCDRCYSHLGSPAHDGI